MPLRGAQARSLILLLWGALPALGGSLGAAERFTGWPDLDSMIRTDGPAVVRIPTAALLLSGLSGGSIRANVLATPLGIGEPSTPVSFQVEIDGTTLSTSDETGTVSVDVFVYAFDSENEVAGSTSQSVSIDLQRHGAMLMRRGLQVLMSMPLPPGGYTVRVLVRNRNNGNFGLDASPLEVPLPDDNGATTLPPWVLDPLGGWLLALPGDGSDRDGAAILPLEVGDAHYLPAARPIVRSGSTIRACLLVGAPDVGAWMLAARFFRPDGVQIAEIPFAVSSRAASPWPGLEAAFGLLKVPDLPSGQYAIRAALYDADGLSIESTELPVLVTEPEGGESVAALEPGSGEFPRSAAATVAPLDSPRSTPRHRGKIPAARRREISMDYLGVLRLLAGGDPSAHRALQGLESRVGGAARADVLRGLERIEWDTLATLAGKSWRSLLPVFLLHAGLIGAYSELGQSPLADHSIRLSTRLAESLARSAASPGERIDASRALVAMAGYLHQLGRMSEGDQLLERALSLDDENEQALLSLAVSHEYQGNYEEATDTLRHLVDRRPDHAEGRLRLAVNLQRSGQTDRAQDLLRSLAASDVGVWIAALAAHELVRLEVEAGRFDEAVGILRQAIERWPDRASLQVQLAYLLDRRARPRMAGELVRELIVKGT
ncbi:MAG: tetratricopeptide repeat protein, partial [Thermoanaerobaculia bacterium]